MGQAKLRGDYETRKRYAVLKKRKRDAKSFLGLMIATVTVLILAGLKYG